MKTSLGGYSSLHHYRLNKRLARRGGIKRGGTTRCRFKGRLEEGEIEIPLLGSAFFTPLSWHNKKVEII